MSEANVITISVFVGLAALAGLILLILWFVRRRSLKPYRKLKRYYKSNPEKGVIDQDPKAWGKSRKTLHDDTIPALEEEGPEDADSD